MAVKRARVAYITYSLLLMILGVVLTAASGFAVTVMAKTIGALITACGIAKAILYFVDDSYGLAFQFDLAQGIFFIVIGLLLVIKPIKTLEFINVIVGIIVIADGSLKVQTAKEAKSFGMRCWITILALAILTAIAGIILVISPFAHEPIALIGIALILDGLQNLSVAIYTISLARRKNKGVVEND